MPERQNCDLSHYVMQSLAAGRLKCISRIPIIAGDSLELDSQIMIRLNQLRRPLAVDFKVDVFAFFCPYRYAYPQWVQHIEAGPKSTATFGVHTGFIYNGLEAMMMHNTSVPHHIWHDYANIYNCYFRDPSQPEVSLNVPQIAQTMNRDGLLCGHLKGWATAQSHMNPADGNELIPVTSGNIVFQDIRSAQSRLRNENFRDFYSSRYVEIMRDMAGSPPSDYSDNVPELVWRDSVFMSGYDVNGTSGSQLGASVGKGVAMLNFRVPRRLFTEYGTFYVFALMRLPPVFTNSVQYLDNLNRPFQHVVPSPMDNLPPVALTMQDLFWQGSPATSAGRVPVCEWYRDHPNYIASEFDSVDTGWQYFESPNTADGLISHGNVDHMFVSSGLRHAVITSQHNVDAWRPIPSASSSLLGDL